ncbi:hypothetical protein FKW77_000309 [Venturia effusa]|uniref:Uncharacterized protein n=1 Tax=Venturia effusa TaxID=50376 RepID=A0A517LJJ1_9PEZI|nr:hypothetical protein FKW77_000309 [Venturia effusa]
MYFVNNDFRFNITDHDHRDFIRFRQIIPLGPGFAPRRRHLFANEDELRPLMYWVQPSPVLPSTSAQIATRKANLLHYFEKSSDMLGFRKGGLEASNPPAPNIRSWHWRTLQLNAIATQLRIEAVPWKQAKPVLEAAIHLAQVCGER